jgi:hypothetical protein
MATLVGAAVLQFFLLWIEVSIVRWLVPEWEPPDDLG